jgi:hypothetical protein
MTPSTIARSSGVEHVANEGLVDFEQVGRQAAEISDDE